MKRITKPPRLNLRTWHRGQPRYLCSFASERDFLWAAASIVGDPDRCLPHPDAGRCELHGNGAIGSARDARPASVGLGIVPGICSGNTDAGKDRFFVYW